MARRGIVIGGALLLVVAGAGLATRSLWTPEGVAKAQAPAGAPQRVIPVDVAVAERGPVPVQIDALGTVLPIASVAIKSRLETEIVEVHFKDGEEVKEGDPLFTLDSRALEAQIAQAEGVVLRDKAQLDFDRASELMRRGVSTQAQRDRFLDRAHHDDLLGAVRQRDGGGGEGAEHINDDHGTAGAACPVQQAVHHDTHPIGSFHDAAGAGERGAPSRITAMPASDDTSSTVATGWIAPGDHTSTTTVHSIPKPIWKNP